MTAECDEADEGLEPSTLCMARTERFATAGDSGDNFGLHHKIRAGGPVQAVAGRVILRGVDRARALDPRTRDTHMGDEGLTS